MVHNHLSSCNSLIHSDLKAHTSIAKNFTQVLVMSGESNTNVMGLKTFLDTILLLKRHQFEGIFNRIKINGMVNNHLSIAVTCIDLKRSMKMSLKIINNI